MRNTPPFEQLNTEEVPSNAVRRAAGEDAARIAAIATAVNIHQYAHMGRGFLVYTLSADEYRKRIDDDDCVYVFSIEGQIVGFICAYDRRQFDAYVSDGTLRHEPTISKCITTLAARRGDERYVFLDQIALLPEYQDRGFGEICFQRFCQQVKGPYYAAMVEIPIRNPRIDYWQTRGFIRIGEVDESLTARFAAKEKSNLVASRMHWGIYVLPDGGFRTLIDRNT